MSLNAIQLMSPGLWQPKIDLFKDQCDKAHCQIDAQNDIAAVSAWLNRQEVKTTFTAYKKEAERFLLWCTFERGLYLSQLKVQDFEEYFRFAQNPPPSWVAAKRAGKKGRVEGEWRPFLGPLNKISLMAAMRILNSLMNYLVNADYLTQNPIRLVRKTKYFSQEVEARRLKVKERMLEADEWQAVQQAIAELPEGNKGEIDFKLRTQWLFSLLYLLGLRIHEVANHTWGDFKQSEGSWYFKVLGKGEKLRRLEINDQLLSMIKIYRLHFSKTPLPNSHETEHLIVSEKTKKPLKIRQLFECVKNIGKLASQKFAENPDKVKKLQSLSPHWIRHTLGSHLDQAGFNLSMIQAILRHESPNTSQIYIHTEEKQRREAMQKIKMDIEPKMIVQKPERSVTELKLVLKGDPLSETQELERFIELLEIHILQGLKWNSDSTRDELVQKYQKISVFKMPLEFIYYVDGIIDSNRIDYIKKSIAREAEIRLFDCEVGLDIRT